MKKVITYEEIVKNIRSEIKKQGRSYTWIAEQLGITKPALYANFYGLAFMTIDRQLKIAELIGVDPTIFYIKKQKRDKHF